MLFPLEGRVTLDGEVLGPEALAVLPPALDHRSRVVCSDAGARVLRVTFGLGNGLIVRSR